MRGLCGIGMQGVANPLFGAGCPGGGFSPIQISGLSLWLKADTGVFTDDAATTPATADGNVIAVWQDQSGNGYHVSQTDNAKRPLLKLAANGINGQPAILFDGSDDYLIRVVNDWLKTQSAGSVIAVYKWPATVTTQNIVLASGATVGTSFYLMFDALASGIVFAQISQRNGDTNDLLTGNTDVSTGAALRSWLTHWRSDGADYFMRINGENQVLTATSGSDTGDWFADTNFQVHFTVGAKKDSVGLSQYFSGSIAEILEYDHNLTSSEITQLEAYLNAKYDVIYPTIKITHLGDSIPASTSPVSYAYLLDSYLYRNGMQTTYNRAVGGQNIMSNMDAQVLAAASDNANIIIIELGTGDNDAGDMVALQAEVAENITELKLSNAAATIYYLNVLPRWTDSGGGTPVAKGNIRTAIAAACTAQGITCWDTFTDPWINAGDTSDGTHPTAAGHVKILNRIVALLP